MAEDFSQAHLVSILNTTHDIVFSVEPVYVNFKWTGRFRTTLVNQRFLDATGLTLDDVIGKDVSDFIGPANYRLTIARFADAIASRAPVYWDAASVWPTGVKHGLFVVVPVYTMGGECRELVGWVHDTARCRRIAADRGLL